MDNIYYRVSYEKVGIYEALKTRIWDISKTPIKDWETLKKSSAFSWLKTPSTYSKNSCSYFTKLGYDIFMKNTYYEIVRYLNENNIIIEKFVFDKTKINLVYEDEYQIVVEQEKE